MHCIVGLVLVCGVVASVKSSIVVNDSELKAQCNEEEGVSCEKTNKQFQNNTIEDNNGKKTDEIIPWINAILASEMPDFIPITSNNQLCARHSEIFRASLENLTLWAVQMYDAWNYVPSGSIYGDVYNVGNFEQCVSVHENMHNISGRYCLVQLQYSPAKEHHRKIFSEKPVKVQYYNVNPRESVFKKVKENPHISILPRNIVYLSFCLPSSCSFKDVEVSLNTQLNDKIENRGYITHFLTSASTCYSRDDDVNHYTTPYIMYLIFTLTLILATAFATLQDICYPESSMNTLSPKFKDWILAFSVMANSKKLVDKKSDDLSIVSALKILFTFILIFGHRYFGIHAFPVTNREELEERNVMFFQTLYINGPTIVNTFIAISGFLTFRKILIDISNNRKMNIFNNILRRWCRLTPLFVFSMASYTFLFSSFSDRLTNVETKFLSSCYQYWWTHLLYIHNYLFIGKQCLLTGWYLAMDMQLYVLCLLVGSIMYKSKKVGFIILVSLFLISIPIPAIAVYYYKYEAVPKLYIRGIQPTPQSLEIQKLYFSTHTRAVAYITGMLGAYIHHHLKKINYRFSNVTLGVSLVGIPTSAILLILAAHTLHNPNYQFNLWHHMLYASSDRLIWSSIFVYTIILHSTTGFGGVNGLIDRRIYVPFNNLTYGAMLMHPLIQFYSFSMARSPANASHFNTHWMAFGDIVLTYLCSLAIYILVEAPFETIINKALNKVLKRKDISLKTQ